MLDQIFLWESKDKHKGWLYINKLTGKVELRMFKAPKPKKFLLATSSTSVV